MPEGGSDKGGFTPPGNMPSGDESSFSPSSDFDPSSMAEFGNGGDSLLGTLKGLGTLVASLLVLACGFGVAHLFRRP